MGRINNGLALPGKVEISVMHHASNAAQCAGAAFVIGGTPVLVTTGGVDIVTDATLRMAAALVQTEIVGSYEGVADEAHKLAIAVLKRCQQGEKPSQTDATDKDLGQ